MQPHKQLLLANKAWAFEVTDLNPDYFHELAKGQEPRFLWIGCSDSRVSPTEITQSQPGEIFIHRNIANMVVEDDLNLLSVVEFAVKVLKVKDIIVCGHYGCGGVKATIDGTTVGLMDAWLAKIKKVYTKHKKEVDAVKDPAGQVNCLVEHNVREQLSHLANHDIIKNEWKVRKDLSLHGWVYNMEDGQIKTLLDISAEDSAEAA